MGDATMNGHELPPLLVATQLAEQALRAIDCWASLADRLEQLAAVREPTASSSAAPT